MQQTLLIVEDDEALRETLGACLSEDYLQILFAGDGIEALDVMTKNHIDFVLSDVKMPRLDGFELLLQVQLLENDKPVVYLMSGQSQYSKAQILAAGAKDYFTKPVDIDFLRKLFSAQKI